MMTRHHMAPVASLEAHYVHLTSVDCILVLLFRLLCSMGPCQSLFSKACQMRVCPAAPPRLLLLLVLFSFASSSAPFHMTRANQVSHPQWRPWI